jgi:hypothetical protein
LVVSPVALVCTRLPDVAASYHLNVPAVALLAERVTVPGPHVEPAVTVGEAGAALTVAVMAVRGVLSQPLAFFTVT